MKLLLLLGAISLIYIKCTKAESSYICGSTISISIDVTQSPFTIKDQQIDTIYVNTNRTTPNSNCLPTSKNGSFIKFSFNYSECDPVITKTEEMIVYTYTIWNEYDKTGVIITDVPKFFKVKCEYLLKAEVDVDLEDKYSFLSCLPSGVEVNIKIFDDFGIDNPESDHVYISDSYKVNPPSECLPVTKSSILISFKFDYSQCDQIVKYTNDGVFYKYTIRNDFDINSLIRKLSRYEIECYFPVKAVTSLAIGLQPPSQSVVAPQQSQPTMRMMISSSDEGKVVEGSILAGTRVHVDVGLLDEVNNTDSVVVLNDCQAFQYPDGSGKTYSLLKDGCPESNGDTDEVNVISNGNSTTSSFEFTSFEWRNLSKQEVQQMSISCNVNQCNQNQTNCLVKCDNEKQEKRSLKKVTEFAPVVVNSDSFVIKHSNGMTQCSKNHNCSDKCIKYTKMNKESCYCWKGRKLLDDGKTCISISLIPLQSSVSESFIVGSLFVAVIVFILVIICMCCRLKQNTSKEHDLLVRS